MLKLDLIDRTQDFFDMIANLEHLQKIIVVTPNPQVADLVRTRFDNVGLSVESLTISKFIKNELNQLIEPEQIENFKGKSELMLVLGAIWKKINPKGDFISFKKAFNLLTEFRSFSISTDVLETVLENYNKELREQVLWMQRFLEQLDIIDEHKSYYLLSEALRESYLPPEYEHEQFLIFYGFDFLTGLQVDLLKAYALRSEVHIPFYKSAYENSLHLDWINWFDTNNLSIEDLSSEEKEQCSLHKVVFPKNHLSLYIEKSYQSGMDVLIGSKKISREILQEIPLNKLRYKVATDTFEEAFAESVLRLDQLIFENIETQSLLESIESLAKEYVQNKNMLTLKCIMIFMNKILEWNDLSSENNTFGLFDYEVIKESVALDIPRINITSLNKGDVTNLYSISEIEKIKQKKLLFCLSSSFDSMNSNGPVYSENVEKYLSSIGPLRRSELELGVLTAKIEEMIIDNEVVFLVENDLIEHQTYLHKIFKKVEMKTFENLVEVAFDKEYLETMTSAATINAISASRLQKYIDCPKLYYLNYEMKLNPEIKLKAELSPLELGQIEHKVIELYLTGNKIYDKEKHQKLIQEVLGPYLKGKEIDLIDEYLIEIENYSLNAISFLLNIFSKQGQFKVDFEYSFRVGDPVAFNGSIDCLIRTTDATYIIDFKRSNRIFTSYGAIENFEQIQLWFYCSNLKKLNEIKSENIVIGYIDLSDLENSMFITSSSEFAKEIKSNFGVGKVKGAKDFDELFSEYEDLQAEKLNELLLDKLFLPKPKDSNVCNYCLASKICSRSLVNGQS